MQDINVNGRTVQVDVAAYATPPAGHLVGGRVQQTNFHQYRLLRINEAPKVHTYLVESSADPGGIGEPATALVAPAIANAVFRATGKRHRSLPLMRHGLA